MTATLMPIVEGVRHDYYCEPFGGGASVLLAKRPVSVETYNDLDNGLYDFFMVLSDPELFAQFYRRVEALPYSRQLFNDARECWQNETDKIKRVVYWYVVARQSFGGDFGNSWGMAVGSSTRGMAATNSKWLSVIDQLPDIHARLQRVQIENKPAIECMQQYDSVDTLFYCDPPYIHDTRSAGGYTHEMTNEQHEELVECLLSVKGAVVLSGYNHPIYSAFDRYGWKRLDFETVSYAAGKTRHTGIQGAGSGLKMQARTESVWVKPGFDRQLRLL